MTRELNLRLLATPTLKLANIGLGDLSSESDTQRRELRSLSSIAKRREWSAQGFARHDGSFPIPTVAYLRQALQAYTFAEDRPTAKRWIIRRARSLSRTDLLPDSWGYGEPPAITAAAVEHTGVMVAIYPTEEVAQALAGSEDGDEPPEEMHVTLAYMGDMTDFGDEDFAAMARAVGNAATAMQPLTAHAQGFGTFVAPDGNNPRWWSIDSVGIAELRTMLVVSLEAEGIEPKMDHDFVPHMTVRYGGEELKELPPGGDKEWPVSELVLVIGGNRQPFIIGGANPEAQREFGLLATPLEEFKKGNGENLEKYWKRGEGAVKIRWGTGGDFTRCDRHLTKYVGPVQAKRICAQWHHDMNGFWPGDKKNNSLLNFEEGYSMSEHITASVAAGWEETFSYYWNPDTNTVYRTGGDAVEVFAAGEGDDPAWREDDLTVEAIEQFASVDDEETLTAIVGSAMEGEDAPELPEGAGKKFRIPVVIPEGVPSGDKRSFARDSLEFKEPPIPLLWQQKTAQGHDNSVTVGKITKIERTDGGLGNAEGVFDTHPDAIEAARQVKEKFLTGVSGDVDQFDAELSEDGEGGEVMEIRHGRLVAATLVAKPAFQEATIEFVHEDGDEPVIIASAGPLHPPREWFSNPQLDKPTQLTVGDDGRVYGHIAEWGTEHMGDPRLKPPRSYTNYKYFNSKALRTQDGSDVKVGQLTLAGGHADISLPVDRVVAHYDDTRSAVADVVAGEDEFGIWVAGAMRPDVSDVQVRAFRASEPSGDWRTTKDGLELVAVCQVNTPGFPVARALVASAGTPTALVAAGVVGRDKQRVTHTQALLADMSSRLEHLEKESETRRKMEALEVIQQLKDDTV